MEKLKEQNMIITDEKEKEVTRQLYPQVYLKPLIHS